MTKYSHTETHIHPKHPRLALVLPSTSKNFLARTYLNGRLRYKSTKPTDSSRDFALLPSGMPRCWQVTPRPHDSTQHRRAGCPMPTTHFSPLERAENCRNPYTGGTRQSVTSGRIVVRTRLRPPCFVSSTPSGATSTKSKNTH